MKKVSLCLFSVLFFVLASGVWAEEKIEFALTNLQDASVFDASEYRDNYLIIVFGSIYCRPCIQLLPVMNKLHADYKASGVVVVGIDIDHTTRESVIRDFMNKHEIAFPFLLDNRNLARQMRVAMLPVILIVDKGGEIKNRQLGFKPYSFFESELEKLGVERD